MTYYKKKKLKTVLVGWSKWNIGKSEREGSLDFLFGGVGWVSVGQKEKEKRRR